MKPSIRRQSDAPDCQAAVALGSETVPAQGTLGVSMSAVVCTVSRAFPGECGPVRAFGVSLLVCTAENLFDAPLHDGAPTEEHVGPAVRDSGAWPVGDAEVWVKLIHTSWSLIRKHPDGVLGGTVRQFSAEQGGRAADHDRLLGSCADADRRGQL